jgi:hypothetical protein
LDQDWTNLEACEACSSRRVRAFKWSYSWGDHRVPEGNYGLKLVPPGLFLIAAALALVLGAGTTLGD